MFRGVSSIHRKTFIISNNTECLSSEISRQNRGVRFKNFMGLNLEKKNCCFWFVRKTSFDIYHRLWISTLINEAMDSLCFVRFSYFINATWISTCNTSVLADGGFS